MNFDLYHDVKVVRLIDPEDHASTADITSQEVDTKGFQSLVLAFALGSLNDLAATVEVQHSDTSGSGFAAVPDTELHGLEADLTIAATDDDKVAQIGYHGGKRYVRVVVTVSTGSGVNVLSAVGILGHPEKSPTTPTKFNP